MSVSSIVLKLVIPALALISFGLQFGGLNGCDIFRIHFKALNDNGIYFNNDPWVGLGLLSHQTFLGKNTQFWNHDSTCVIYDELESEMFKEGNLGSIEFLIIAGMVITMIVAIFAIVRACCFVTRTQLLSETVKEVTFCVTITITLVASLSLQAYAFDSLHSDGGICDRDTYYPTAWNENYPFQTYPAYSYFKFFHKCSLGKDGVKIRAAIALNGIIAFMATVIALFNLASILIKTTNTDYVEKKLKDTLSINNGSSLRSMRKNDDEDDDTVSVNDYPSDVEEN